MGAIKVNNDEVWNEYVKTGKVKGFSVEGYFADKAKKKKKDSLSEIESEEILEAVRKLFSEKITLESYNDYPQSVINNAKRGIELNKKVNNKCATLVGKNRARQLVAKEKLSVSTIKRLYSYLSRAETYYDPKDNEACGTISFLLWGGKSAKNWAESKLKKLGELKLKSEVVDENYAIIMDRLAYSSKDMAEKIAEDIGCKGTHEHEFEGKTWYMPCEKHAMAKVGPRGGIVKSPKAPGSRKNRNPKGVGSAGRSAKGRTGAKVTAADRDWETINSIEDVAGFVLDLIDEQKKGNLPYDLLFLWDSIGSVPCEMSIKSNKNNNEWNAGAMSTQFGNNVNQRIVLSRKESKS